MALGIGHTGSVTCCNGIMQSEVVLCACAMTPASWSAGEHPTTRLCLQQLEAQEARLRQPGCSVMDYGAGREWLGSRHPCCVTRPSIK